MIDKMVNTAIEEEMIRNIELLTKEILNKMNDGDRTKVRELSKYFDDIIDSYCLDRIWTYHKQLK